MCGIAGIIPTSLSTKAEAPDIINKMTKHMRPRGPDAVGTWVGEGIVIGHRRLAIIDLDARANQPMVSDDGKYVIAFNGEIYNFRELRQILEVEGYSFRTTSDTEVLLALFAHEGELMLSKLRGMFSLAIWNTQTKELFLARDPYGIKPLYYTKTKDCLLFASQVKTLLASGHVKKEIEAAGLAGFYLWGSVPEPWTVYRDVFALPAGHWLKVQNGVIDKLMCWYDIRTNWRTDFHKEAIPELQERVREAVLDSVHSHLVADVPVSVFLSGGIDSATVAGMASSLGAKVEGITIGFDEFANGHEDEVPIASTISKLYGLPHFIKRVTRYEFEQDIPHIFSAMDQPSIDGVNTWFASKAAAERGYKVVLSGIGGDELFCGYPSFRQVPRSVTLGRALAAVPGLRKIINKPCKFIAHHRNIPKLAGLPKFMNTLEGMYFMRRSLYLPDELPRLMGADFAFEGLNKLRGWPPGMIQNNARDSVSTIGSLESTNYLRHQLLRDSDWASMSHSLELRTPLVDVKLLEALGAYVTFFAKGNGKYMLAKSPDKPLSDEIIKRPKTGFSIPMAKWLTEAVDQSTQTNSSLSKISWGRQWAKIVAERMT
jgi:asparagine synthase (glutamine-hydrolysing)